MVSYTKGDLVEVVGGKDQGKRGEVTAADNYAVYVRIEAGVVQVLPGETKLNQAAPPPPYLFQTIQNPDGWSAMTDAACPSASWIALTW